MIELFNEIYFILCYRSMIIAAEKIISKAGIGKIAK